MPSAASPNEQSWRAAAQHPGLWPAVEFAALRDGTRRSELRRLLSLAAWAARYAGATRTLAISARLPADAQPTGLKAASAVALAAAGALQELSLTANRGFWPGEWLPRLVLLRSLRLCSKEGGLSLHGDLRGLSHLTRLVLEAKHAVQLSDTVRWARRRRGIGRSSGTHTAEAKRPCTCLVPPSTPSPLHQGAGKACAGCRC